MAEKSVRLDAARQSEKEGNFMTAVLHYIMHDDVKNVRRIAPKAAEQYGTASCIGFALDKFSKLEENSKESANYFIYLQNLASMQLRANLHLERMLHEDAFIASDKPGRYPHY